MGKSFSKNKRGGGKLNEMVSLSKVFLLFLLSWDIRWHRIMSLLVGTAAHLSLREKTTVYWKKILNIKYWFLLNY